MNPSKMSNSPIDPSRIASLPFIYEALVSHDQKRLLKLMNEEPGDSLVQSVFFRASKKECRAILEKRNVSYPEFEMAVHVTAFTSDCDLLAFLLFERRILADHLNIFLVRAVRNHQKEVIACFLKYHSICPLLRGELVYLATRGNYFLLVKLLLDNGPILDETRGDCLITAVYLENELIISALISHGNIPPSLQKEAEIAANGSNKEKLLALLTQKNSIGR